MIEKIAKQAPTLLRDVAGLAAVASITYGASLIYVPAGFIVGGIIVLVGVILAARGGE